MVVCFDILTKLEMWFKRFAIRLGRALSPCCCKYFERFSSKGVRS
jgi:hypothetical protein